MRGNVRTRLGFFERGDVDALILARAGLLRLGITDLNLHALPFAPAPAQGIIAIQAPHHAPHWDAICHPKTLKSLHLERALVRGLGANCRLPVALDLSDDQAVLEAWHEQGTVLSKAGPVRTVAEAEALGAALLSDLPPGYFGGYLGV